MATLIPDARSARLEAARLRAETQALEYAVRKSASRSCEQLRAAESSLSRVRARRCEPVPSPWSTLNWASDDESLAGVLVSLP